MKAEGLLQKAKIQTALWLPWDVVGELISSMLERLLNRPFTARAEYCDVDYWCCEFGQNYLDLNTQERLFMAMEATEAERQGTIAYCDEQNEVRLPINSLGMEVSQKILLMSRKRQMKELLGTYRPGVLKIRLVFNRNDITGIVKDSLVFKATYSLVETFQEIKDFLIFKKKQQEQEGCSGKTILTSFQIAIRAVGNPK